MTIAYMVGNPIKHYRWLPIYRTLHEANQIRQAWPKQDLRVIRVKIQKTSLTKR